MRRYTAIVKMVMLMLLMVACGSKSGTSTVEDVQAQESREAKNMLQGIWVDEDTEEPSFRVVGDTIFYPDTISQPVFFAVISDSLVLHDVDAKYPIVKQSPHVFWFRNQNGEVVKLQKSDDPIHLFAFVHDRPQVLTYTEVVKTDSVVFFDARRYHWYLAINPTKYKVHIASYNSDGVEVDNVYYDNIMHISVFEGSKQLFSSDIRKQLYAKQIPSDFLEKSVLSNMEYAGVDKRGLRFVATICIPDGASCYKAEHIISFDGRLSTNLIEY